MTDHIDTSALRKLAEAAHPGPWRLDFDVTRINVINDLGNLLARIPRGTKDGPPTFDDASAIATARFIEACRNTLPALLDEVDALRSRANAQPSEAQQVCSEAYQVVGCLLSDVGLFGTEKADKILDNLSQARMVHQDVLPWDSVEGSRANARSGEPVLWMTVDTNGNPALACDGSFVVSHEPGSWYASDYELGYRDVPLYAAPAALHQPVSEDATPDQLLELAGALEQRRALAIVENVTSLSAGYHEGAFRAGYESACEEITHRLRTEVWEGCLPPVDAALQQPKENDE